jgi:hypothetical protein
MAWVLQRLTIEQMIPSRASGNGGIGLFNVGRPALDQVGCRGGSHCWAVMDCRALRLAWSYLAINEITG